MNRPEEPTPKTSTLADLVDELYADVEAAHKARSEGKPRGPVTSFGKLDQVLGGFLAPGLHVAQAAPGAGKSAFCLQVATECGFPALYVTAEMKAIELFRRVVARATNTFLGRLKNGDLTPEEVKALAHSTARRYPKLAIMDASIAYAHPGNYILPAAEALRARFEAKSLLLVIDALQPWARGASSEATEYDLVNAGLTAAQGLANLLDCPVLCVSHRNRTGQQKGGMHAAKGSGDVEYAAETILELTPESGGVNMVTGERKVKVEVHKNRHGETGKTVELQFEGRLQRFREEV